MTEDQRKKMLADFGHPVHDVITDDWTEDEIIKSAKRIIKRLGIDGKITSTDTDS